MTPGIHRIAMADYVADPCPAPSLSAGCAFRLLNESPLHAWHYHPRLGGRTSAPSDASEAGTIAHDLLLGGEGKICEIRREDFRSKPTKENPEGSIPVGWTNNAIREARDVARANGLTPMLSEDLIGVRAMVKAARDFIAGSAIAGVFDAGESELTVIAQDGDTWLRTRPDWLNLEAGISLSYKTTRGAAAPDKFARLADSCGYWFSAMFYEHALDLALGEEVDVTTISDTCRRIVLEIPSKRIRHVILAQEQTAPYACALYELAPAKAAIERSQVARAIALWKRCLSTNSWPGYSSGIVRVEPKPWDLAAEEERLQAEELEGMEA